MDTSYPKAEVEKIRVYRWSRENTEQNQILVNELHQARQVMITVSGHDGAIVGTLARAMRRFAAIDPAVVLPAGV